MKRGAATIHMKLNFKPLILDLLLAIAGPLVTSCYTAPVTGRSQLILLTPSQENEMGLTAFKEVLKDSTISDNQSYNEAVSRVGNRIAQVADTPDYEWDFKVIEDDEQINAFALPGGKVGVYTGILPVAKTEGGLAAVMSHEVAHVLARHGGERLSHGLLAQMGAVAIQAGMAGSNPGVVRGVMTAYGLGANVGVLLPYGRLQESEADRIGILLMAQAGHDPREAVHLWERMAQQSRRQPPQFLSTHPSPRRRIQDLQRLVPNALTHYRPSPGQAHESTRLLPGINGRKSK